MRTTLELDDDLLATARQSEAPERSHSRLRAAVTRSSVHNAPTKSKYATSMRSEKLTISMVNPLTAGTHPSKTNGNHNPATSSRSEEHTSELQSRQYLV